MSEDNNELKKLTIFTLGDCAVGKSSFISKYIHNTFSENHLTTIGIDFITKDYRLPNEKEIKLFFYDTAGQEKYRSLSFNLIKSADGIFLMYDISERVTFDGINHWIESIKEIKGNNFPKILLGNKCDLDEEKRKVTKEEGEKLANDHGFSFFETSCKEGTNIEGSVEILVSKIIEKRQLEEKENKQNEKENNKNEKERNTFGLEKTQKKKKKKKCC